MAADYAAINFREDDFVTAVKSLPNDSDAIFGMIDPFGYKDIPMKAILELLMRPRTDLMVTFMGQHLNRFKNVNNKEFFMTQTALHAGGYRREVLEPLEKQGAIRVNRPSKRGFPEGTEIEVLLQQLF